MTEEKGEDKRRKQKKKMEGTKKEKTIRRQRSCNKGAVGETSLVLQSLGPPHCKTSAEQSEEICLSVKESFVS